MDPCLLNWQPGLLFPHESLDFLFLFMSNYSIKFIVAFAVFSNLFLHFSPTLAALSGFLFITLSRKSFIQINPFMFDQF